MDNNPNDSGARRLMPVGNGQPRVFRPEASDDSGNPSPVNIRMTKPIAQMENKCDNPRGLAHPNCVPDIHAMRSTCGNPCRRGINKWWLNETPAPINLNLKMSKCSISPDSNKMEYKQEPLDIQYPDHSKCWSQSCDPRRPLLHPVVALAERAVSTKPVLKYTPNPNPFNGRTTNQTFYHAKEWQAPPAMIKPTKKAIHLEAKMESESLSSFDYKGSEVSRPFRPIWADVDKNYNVVQGSVSGVSIMKASYRGGIGKPAQSTRSFYIADPDRPHLDTRTSYNMAHVPFTREQYPKKVVPEKYGPGLRPSFRGKTTYQRDFVPLIEAPRKLMSQNGPTTGDTYYRTGNTTYQVEFEPFSFTEGCHAHLTKDYDQIYPRPCAMVNCDPDETGPPEEPHLKPSPPCPPPKPETPPCVNDNYKVEVKNEENIFEPTEITITAKPSIYYRSCR